MKEASVMDLVKGSCTGEWCHIRNSMLASAVGKSQILVGEEKTLLLNAE